VFPSDCSANCWGASAMLVFTLKRIDSITEYALTLLSASIRHDRAVRSHGQVQYLVPHQSLTRFFYTFRLTIVLEGISGNWTRQEAAQRRRLPSSFHRKLRLRSNKPTQNFPPFPSNTLAGWSRAKRSKSASALPFPPTPRPPPSSRPHSSGVSAGAA